MKHQVSRRLTACAAFVLLACSQAALAAPWQDYLSLPSGDEVMVRGKGRALRPSGSRAEVDLPVRVRFAAPVATPAGPVAMADARVRVLCKDRSVTAARLTPRLGSEKTLPAEHRKAAVQAVRASVDAAIAAPAFLERVCQGAKV